MCSLIYYIGLALRDNFRTVIIEWYMQDGPLYIKKVQRLANLLMAEYLNGCNTTQYNAIHAIYLFHL